MQFTRRGSLAAAIALGAMILAVPALAEDGVTADTITFGQAAVLEGPASALGLGMQKRPQRGIRRDQRQGRRAWPQDQADQRERRLRAGSRDRRDQEADRGGQGVRADRPGRHADLGRRAADRHRRQGAVHGRFHRRGLPAQSQARQRHQCARELRRRDRGLGEAPHRGPEDLQDRDLLPGRRVRPRRPLRLQEGDGEAQDGDRSPRRPTSATPSR